jgi:hypothetical protein
MPGLVPGIHEFLDVDRRDKPGDDERQSNDESQYGFAIGSSSAG